ncbi:MAG TPA: HD domain-containing phosphohydrolase [Pseudoneobacillus sp.]|nr:HD domain-containing phosphohydrolase [Pseudoneobacillus sp.]
MQILKDFQTRMIRNYIIGSLIAVFGVGSTFIFHTLVLSQKEIYSLLLIMVLSVGIMILCEFLVYKRHIYPIKFALSQNHPPLVLVEEAYRTAHLFPILTVKRIVGPHFLGLSLPASLLTWIFIYLEYINFPYYYIGLAWAGAALVAITHAMIEFFLAFRSTKPLITHFNRLAFQKYSKSLTLSKKDLVSIRMKLLLSSTFIAIIPILLFILALEVRLNQNAVMNTSGYWEWAIVILIVIIFLAIYGSVLLYENIQTPFNHLLAKMNQVQKGRLEQIENIYSDEYSHLIDGFNHMVHSIQERDLQNELLLESFFTVFAATLDARDPYTAGHSIRVADYTVKIAEAEGLSISQIDLLRKSALLHDIGKIGVRDTVLLKEDRLTDEEFAQIKMHPVIGAKILEQINLPNELEAIVPGVKYHHERYDGKGYPEGLSGENIPLFGRMMAVADAYDAMTSDRPYRKGMASEKALSILEAGKGTQWDPKYVDTMVRIMTL